VRKERKGRQRSESTQFIVLVGINADYEDIGYIVQVSGNVFEHGGNLIVFPGC